MRQEIYALSNRLAEDMCDLLAPSPDKVSMKRSDFSALMQFLSDVAEDGGTQPAYRKGMYRAMSAVQNALIENRNPVESARDTVLVYEPRGAS